MNQRANNIIDFWFVKTPPEKRFKKDEAFDLDIRNNFMEDYNLAKSGEYEDWLNTPKECLALIILLDQFSRNLFRDKKEAFDQDHKARLAVNQGIYLGHLQELNEAERLFFLLPLIHSEELIDHERAYALSDKYLKNHHVYFYFLNNIYSKYYVVFYFFQSCEFQLKYLAIDF